MLRNINFKVTGMHCNSCVNLITMELSDVIGITGITLDFKTGLGNATLTESSLGEVDVLAAVERAGYTARIVSTV